VVFSWVVFPVWFSISCLYEVIKYTTTFFAETAFLRPARASQLRVVDLDVVLAAKITREHAKFVIGRLGAGCMTLGKSLSPLLHFVLEVEPQTRIEDGSRPLVHFDRNDARHDFWIIVAIGAGELL